jgi:hypothetical protein
MSLSGANLIGSTYNGNDNNSLNTYNKLYQQQQAKIANEQKELTTKLSAIKTDGLRQEDRADYNKLYDEWRNSSILASKERDKFKKSELTSDSDKNYIKLNQLISDSKKGGDQLHDVFKSQIGKNPYDTYEEADWNKIKASDKLPISNPNFVKNPYDIQAIPNYSKTSSILQTLDSGMKDLAKLNGKSTTELITRAGKNGVRTIDETAVDPKIQYQRYSDQYTLDPVFARGIRASFANLDWKGNPEQAKDQAMLGLVKNRPLVYQSDPKDEFGYKPDKEKETIPIQSTPSVKFTIGSKGQEVEVLNSQNFSSKSYTLGGTSAYDTDTGKDISIPSTADGVKIGQIGLYPFMINSKITKPVKGKDGKWTKETISGANRIASPDFVKDHRNLVDYREAAIGFYKDKLGGYDTNIIIPASSLPTNDKELNKRLAQLKSDKKNLDIQYNNSKQQTQSSGKIYKTKKYGNFTEEDLKAQYNDSWKEALKKLQ